MSQSSGTDPPLLSWIKRDDDTKSSIIICQFILVYWMFSHKHGMDKSHFAIKIHYFNILMIWMLFSCMLKCMIYLFFSWISSLEKSKRRLSGACCPGRSLRRTCPCTWAAPCEWRCGCASPEAAGGCSAPRWAGAEGSAPWTSGPNFRRRPWRKADNTSSILSNHN